jgi:hypothetical protein
LNEINQQKYQIWKALDKAGRKNTEKYESIVKKLGTISLNNSQIKEMVGPEEFLMLERSLFTEGYLEDLTKIQLIEILKNIDPNPETFQEQCKQLGVYVRELRKNKSSSYSYGYKGQYYKEKQLPRKFHRANIGKDLPPIQFSREQQQAYVKGRIRKALKESRTMQDFKDYLSKFKIDMIEHSNAGGTYGLSFKQQIEGAEQFKGSEVGGSLKSVTNALAKSPQRLTSVKKPLDKTATTSNTPPITSTLQDLKTQGSTEDIDNLKKKRKKKLDEDRDDQNQNL